MKLALIIGLYYVAGFRGPTNDRFLQQQKQKELDKFRFPRDRQGNGIRRGIPESKKSVVSPQGSFEFVISSNEDWTSVSKLITALQVSSGFLENAITFNKRIKVNVEHGTYCSQTSCNRGDALGTCSPNHHMIGRDGSFVNYPYSLVKQGGFGPEPNRSSEFDMEMYLKNSPIFVHPDQYGSHESSQTVDITEVIVHELIHGLGICSSVNTYTLENSAGHPVEYNGPAIRHIYSYKGIDAQFIPNKFDTHLYYDKSRSLQELIRSLDYSGIDRDFISNIKHMPRIQKFVQLCHEPNSTFFWTSRNSKVFVNTNPPRDRDVIDMSHLDVKTYQTSRDFLMKGSGSFYAYYLRQPKLTRGWLTAPIGNHIIEVLETLGYKRNPNPKRDRSQLALYEAMLKYSSNQDNLPYYQPELI